jgi:ribosome-binding protein aMBF1 (putative translation factor)
MNLAKKKQLEKNGWAVGDAGDFLQLSEEERQFVELKLALALGVRELRERLGLTQTEVAERIGSSQSRVAKMEAAEIARWIRKAEGRKAA